jgi:hypothetical protein
MNGELSELDLDKFLNGEYDEFKQDSFMDDEGYVISFTIDDKDAEKFYKKYGFIVYRNVFTSDECNNTRNAMWNIVEKSNPGLIGKDPLTWSKYQSTGKYGLSSRGPTFDKNLVQNRQNINLCKCMSNVMNIPIDDVMVSHDRFTIYRATQLTNEQYGVTTDTDTDTNTNDDNNTCIGKNFLTGKANIHLDMNPWWWHEDYTSSIKNILYGCNIIKYNNIDDFVKENNLICSSIGHGKHIQCVINFMNNSLNDGGTLIVPGSHRISKKWCIKYDKNLKKPRPFITFNEKNQFENNMENKLMNISIRISMKEGSLLIWDQTVFHGTQPNSSQTSRMAQFIKGFSRQAVFYPSFPVAVDETLTVDVSVNNASNDVPIIETANANESSKSKKKKKKKKKASASASVSASVEEEPEAPVPVPVSVDPFENWKYDGIGRLKRRSKLLYSELQSNGALDIVTPLGKTMFGLDIDIDIENTDDQGELKEEKKKEIENDSIWCGVNFNTSTNNSSTSSENSGINCSVM